MHIRSLSVLACTAMSTLAGAVPVSADEVAALRERLTLAADASYQELAREFEIVEASAGQTGSTTFEPHPGKMYFVYGVCGENCSNIDLELEDSNDSWFTESDKRPDATPVVTIPSSDVSRVVTIHLDMVACQAPTCTMGIGIYSVGLD